MWKATLAVVLVIAIAGVLVVRNPVVFAIHEGGNPLKEPVWSLMNPLRDRGPERAAEAILNDLKRGACDEAFARIALPPNEAAEMKESERAYRVHDWNLVGRKDTADTSRLFYRTGRDKSKSNNSPVWITVKRANGKWAAVDYEAWY